jgi:hypothetical protein
VDLFSGTAKQRLQNFCSFLLVIKRSIESAMGEFCGLSGTKKSDLGSLMLFRFKSGAVEQAFKIKMPKVI